jgi:homocysteine S-methyltransferase
VGVNCTAPQHVDELLARARSVTSRPLIVYPNSGESWDAATKRWIDVGGPTVDGRGARRWVEEGASIVGGCCRVTPVQIAAVAAAVAGAAATSRRPAHERRAGDEEPGSAGPGGRIDA